MCLVPKQFQQFDIRLHSFLYNDYEYFAWFAGMDNPQGRQDRFLAVYRWKRLYRAHYDPHEVWNDWENWNDETIQEYSLVTRVFLKHLRDPRRWPLFDINVWKAMRRIDEGIANQVNVNYQDSDYEEFYLPFFDDLYAQPDNDFGQPPQIDGVDEEIIKKRILDRALWEYGRIPLQNG